MVDVISNACYFIFWRFLPPGGIMADIMALGNPWEIHQLTGHLTGKVIELKANNKTLRA